MSESKPLISIAKTPLRLRRNADVANGWITLICAAKPRDAEYVAPAGGSWLASQTVRDRHSDRLGRVRVFPPAPPRQAGSSCAGRTAPACTAATRAGAVGDSRSGLPEAE